MVRIEDLELGRHLDVGGHDLAGLVLEEAHLHLADLAVQPTHQLLEMQDDVGDVFLDSLDGRELVRDAFDLDRADGRALERREQDPPQRVAEGVPEPPVKRLHLETCPVVGKLLTRDVGHLKL